MTRIQEYLKLIPAWIIAATVMALVVAALWLPTGISVSGIQEEWHGRVYLDRQQRGLLEATGGGEFATRPAAIWPFRLAYILTPDSFVANNVITIFLLWGRGFTLYLILRRVIPDHILPAFFVGVIFAIYPADTGIVSLRVSHYHTNLLFFLLAAYLLLRYWDQPRWYIMVAIWGLLGSAMLMVEVTYPFIFLTPFLLLFKERKVTRRWLIVTCLWYLVPSLTFSYSFYMIFVRDVSFQGNTVQVRTLELYRDIILRVYWANLLEGWKYAQALLRLHAGLKEIAVSSIVAIVAFSGGIHFLKYEDDRHKLSMKRFMAIAIISLMMIGAGYAMYLPTDRANLHLSFRVFLLSSLGAAIFWGYSLYVLTYLIFPRAYRQLYILGMSFLVALAILWGVYAHHEYAKISAGQGKFLAQITQQVPQLEQPATILLMQTPGRPTYAVGQLPNRGMLFSALQYIYQDYQFLQDAHFCFHQSVGRQKICVLSNNSASVTAFNYQDIGVDIEIPYEHLIIFEVAPNGTIQLLDSIPQSDDYQPIKLFDESATPPRRINTIFGIPSR